MKSRDILLGFTNLTTSAKRPDLPSNWGQGDAYYQLCSCCGAQFFGPDLPFNSYKNKYSTGIGVFLNVPRVEQELYVSPHGIQVKTKHEYVSLTLGEDVLELTLLVPDDSPTPNPSIS